MQTELDPQVQTLVQKIKDDAQYSTFLFQKVLHYSRQQTELPQTNIQVLTAKENLPQKSNSRNSIGSDSIKQISELYGRLSHRKSQEENIEVSSLIADIQQLLIQIAQVGKMEIEQTISRLSVEHEGKIGVHIEENIARVRKDFRQELQAALKGFQQEFAREERTEPVKLLLDYENTLDTSYKHQHKQLCENILDLSKANIDKSSSESNNAQKEKAKICSQKEMDLAKSDSQICMITDKLSFLEQNEEKVEKRFNQVSVNLISHQQELTRFGKQIESARGRFEETLQLSLESVWKVIAGVQEELNSLRMRQKQE